MELYNSSGKNEKECLWYFVKEFTTVLNDSKNDFQEVLVAIKGYGYICKACKKYFKIKEVEYMIEELTKTTNNLLFSKSSDPYYHKYIGVMMNSFSVIGLELDSLNDSFIQLMLKITDKMFEIVTSLRIKYVAHAAEGFVSVMNLLFDKNSTIFNNLCKILLILVNKFILIAAANICASLGIVWIFGMIASKILDDRKLCGIFIEALVSVSVNLDLTLFDVSSGKDITQFITSERIGDIKARNQSDMDLFYALILLVEKLDFPLNFEVNEIIFDMLITKAKANPSIAGIYKAIKIFSNKIDMKPSCLVVFLNDQIEIVQNLPDDAQASFFAMTFSLELNHSVRMKSLSYCLETGQRSPFLADLALSFIYDSMKDNCSNSEYESFLPYFLSYLDVKSAENTALSAGLTKSKLQRMLKSKREVKKITNTPNDSLTAKIQKMAYLIVGRLEYFSPVEQTTVDVSTSSLEPLPLCINFHEFTAEIHIGMFILTARKVDLFAAYFF